MRDERHLKEVVMTDSQRLCGLKSKGWWKRYTSKVLRAFWKQRDRKEA